MRKTYTIKIIFASGRQVTESFSSKAAAKTYCLHVGAALKEQRVTAEIIVAGGGAVQSEKFVKEAR